MEPPWQCKAQAVPRRPVFASALVIIAGQAWSAHSLYLGPPWQLPQILTVLLVASIAVYEGHAISRVVETTANEETASRGAGESGDQGKQACATPSCSSKP